MSHGQRRAQASREPQSKISLQFQVLQSCRDLFDELHKPVPDLVGHWALQLAEVLLQELEQECVGPVYDRERLRVGKVRVITYSVVLDIGFLYLSGIVDNRRYMLSQSM